MPFPIVEVAEHRKINHGGEAGTCLEIFEDLILSISLVWPTFPTFNANSFSTWNTTLLKHHYFFLSCCQIRLSYRSIWRVSSLQTMWNENVLRNIQPSSTMGLAVHLRPTSWADAGSSKLRTESHTIPPLVQSYITVLITPRLHGPYQGSIANRDSPKHLTFPILGI